MILPLVINLTRSLDILIQEDGKGISSHDKMKEKGLMGLKTLIENAQDSDFTTIVLSENYEIISGYLVNILCQLIKNDKSNSIKLQSLKLFSLLIRRLDKVHLWNDRKCSNSFFVTALPGITSTLFKITTSDTKLPKAVLALSVENLSWVINLAFAPCDHKNQSDEDLKETCDNLAIRLSYLFGYVTSHHNELPWEMKYEMLKLCDVITCKTNDELVKRILKPIVKYAAFISSIETCPNDPPQSSESKLYIQIIADNIQDRIKNCSAGHDRLDSVVISSLSSLLENLEKNYLTMLSAERVSELSTLSGLMKLLPEESLTTFLEVSEKRSLLFETLTKLCKFSTDQPFLFLTNSNIGVDAMESHRKIYTVEKRFSHLSGKEVDLIRSCCETIGQNTDWLILNDIINCELRQFDDPANLLVTNFVFIGLVKRGAMSAEVNEQGISTKHKDFKFKALRLAKKLIEFYLDQTHEEYLKISDSLEHKETNYSQETMKIVISIETIVTILDLHSRNTITKSDQIIILKSLLCPLLNWSSSSSRAISEASLSALDQIRLIYEYDSIKSLIEANIDYIVDGVSLLLHNFIHNHEVTNVLATTFRLSSISSFCYFKDVYDRVFKLLGAYHHTEKAKSIALLFYRTLTTLDEWKKVDSDTFESEKDPLTHDSTLKAILYDLDVSHRLVKLEDNVVEAQKFRQRLDEIQVSEEEMEKRVMKELKSDKKLSEEDFKEEKVEENDEVSDDRKNRAPELILTEKIMKHCIGLISSNHSEIKILALRTAACGFNILREDENTLLPLVHQLWSPLVNRLTGDYKQNLEINLCAFECLVSMAVCAKDFIRARTLETILPRLCLFLETQARESRGKKDYGPYCMTLAHKCQLKILTHLGPLVYHIQLAYGSLWRVVRTTLIYLDSSQASSLREAARISLHYMIALDADCVWYYAKATGHLSELPFRLIYEA